MSTRRIRLLAASILCLLGGGSLVIGLAGCGSSVQAHTQALGSTTKPEAVVAALEGTGYHMRFRQVPRIEGWEIIAGEATRGHDAVQFVVEIRLAGPIEAASGDELNPQPPVLRYAFREEGTAVGNIVYRTQMQAPKHSGRGIELEVDKAETKMAVEVGIALRRLFADRYRPEG
jgi:hypothetical protein